MIRDMIHIVPYSLRDEYSSENTLLLPSAASVTV